MPRRIETMTTTVLLSNVVVIGPVSLGVSIGDFFYLSRTFHTRVGIVLTHSTVTMLKVAQGVNVSNSPRGYTESSGRVPTTGRADVYMHFGQDKLDVSSVDRNFATAVAVSTLTTTSVLSFIILVLKGSTFDFSDFSLLKLRAAVSYP